MDQNTPFRFGSDSLRIGTAIELAEGSIQGILAPDVVQKINSSQRHVSHIVSQNSTVYGVNTGFGILSNTRISEEDTQLLQHKILQSHSVGVGNPVPADIARLMLDHEGPCACAGLFRGSLRDAGTDTLAYSRGYHPRRPRKRIGGRIWRSGAFVPSVPAPDRTR